MHEEKLGKTESLTCDKKCAIIKYFDDTDDAEIFSEGGFRQISAFYFPFGCSICPEFRAKALRQGNIFTFPSNS